MDCLPSQCTISASASAHHQGMPRELTQNRIQKLWIPSKDDKPAMPSRGGKSVFRLWLDEVKTMHRHVFAGDLTTR